MKQLQVHLGLQNLRVFIKHLQRLLPITDPIWLNYSNLKAHTQHTHLNKEWRHTHKRQKECSLPTRLCEQQEAGGGDDSPRLPCSFQRRREPCSGTCSTAGRPVCGTILLVGRWKGGARRPTTARTPGLFPAWRSLVTSSAASACARWRTTAWCSSSKITMYIAEAGDRSCTRLWR